MRSTFVDEKTLIGAAILTGDRHGTIELEPADFESDFFGKVWKWMRTVREIDTSTLESEFFDQRNDLSDAAGVAAFSTNMEKVAGRIREAAHRRRLLSQLVKAHGLIESGDSIAEVSAMVAKTFDDVRTCDGWKPLMDYLVPAYSEIEKAQTTGESSMFVPSGFVDFDKQFGGIQRGGLIVVAGRPAMGKSAFASAMARKAAEKNPVLMVSMEMSGSQIATRFYASESGVSLGKLTGGGMGAGDFERLVQAQARLGGIGIHINDKRCRSVADVCAEARRFKRVHGDVGMVVVDYLTLMSLPDGYSKNDQVAETTRMLTTLAGEIDAPIVLLSQLNRELEKRANKRPQMSDLRDSGAIEQDAHQIIFPFRPEVYEKKAEYEGLALIEMAKNRNGATGTIQMTWVADQTAFRDFAGGSFDE